MENWLPNFYLMSRISLELQMHIKVSLHIHLILNLSDKVKGVNHKNIFYFDFLYQTKNKFDFFGAQFL